MLLVVPAHRAAACSCATEPGLRPAPRSPWFRAEGFPLNGLFTSSLEWRDAAGRRLPLADDAALSEALGFRVRRLAGEVDAGARMFPIDDCPGVGECEHVLHFAESADETPPSAAEVLSAEVFFARDAPESGASCQVDTLVIEVAGSDESTPADELVVVLFVGATAEEAETASTPTLGMGFDASAGDAMRSTIQLGAAEGHARAGGPLPESGAFCFSAALMDWAGNIGERSAATCTDTRDPADPAVVLVDYSPPCSGPFCSARPGAGARGSWPLLMFASLLGLIWRRAQR